MRRVQTSARRSIIAISAACAVAAASAAVVTATHLAPTSFAALAASSRATVVRPGPGFPAHYAAPYIDTAIAAPGIIAATQRGTGLKYYTLAFIINSKNRRCQATWNQTNAVSGGFWGAAINKLRAAGGDVIISFGGAAGTELARSCHTTQSLETQYKKVIDTYHLSRIDLDIEDAALDDTAANIRRDKALAALQRAYARRHQQLTVDFTVPTAIDGLQPNAIRMLRDATNNGVRINLINIMTMDYGTPANMGDAAIHAASALHRQLAAIWPRKTSQQLWAMEGNTPMIGTNDTTTETFTTNNATTLEQYAAKQGIQELSFWSESRDRACPRPRTLAPTCSGTPQNPEQFAAIFARFKK